MTPLELGAHLPLIAFDGGSRTVAELAEYARAADALGYRWLCANDHLLYQRAWLDGPVALAAALEASGDMTLATTVALPVLRGPLQTARALDALDRLSGGRLVAGLGRAPRRSTTAPRESRSSSAGRASRRRSARCAPC